MIKETHLFITSLPDPGEETSGTDGPSLLHQK
jgi:hypothetical protein